MKLTDRNVASLTCPPGRRDATFADDTVTGFWLRVQASWSFAGIWVTA
jgi:hypothetical protein